MLALEPYYLGLWTCRVYGKRSSLSDSQNANGIQSALGKVYTGLLGLLEFQDGPLMGTPVGYGGGTLGTTWLESRKKTLIYLQ